LTLADFEDKLRSLENQYSTIYYKPHPYTRNKEAIFDIISDSQKIQVIDENIYQLLACEEIEKIFTISSSVYFESRFFEKPGEAFFTKNLDRFDFDIAESNPNSYVPLLDDFLHPKFWAEVLAPHLQTIGHSLIQIPRKTSRLRTSLGCFWGYNFLDAEILYQDIIPKKMEEESLPKESGIRSFFNKHFF
jgi:hypothetical protein